MKKIIRFINQPMMQFKNTGIFMFTKTNFQDARIKHIMLAFALAVILAFNNFISNASAHEYKLDQLEIIHPGSRATVNTAKVAGGYCFLFLVIYLIK